MTYAVVSVTDYYGPRSDYRLLSLCNTLEVARNLAERHDPDYDPGVQCRRLNHNQCSPTRAEVYYVVAEVDDASDVDTHDEAGHLILNCDDGSCYALREID